MKKGLRFQTKLMLTIASAIVIVTLAVIWATETNIRQKYTEQQSIRFDTLVSQLELSREQESSEFLESCRELARHPFVLQFFKDEVKDETREDFIKSVPDLLDRSGPEPRRANRPERQVDERRLEGIALMDLEGEIHFPGSPAGKGPRSIPKQLRGRLRTPGLKERIQSILKTDKQQTVYIPSPNRDNVVEEMIRTPVIDPETGDKLGFFLFKKKSVGTEAQQVLHDYQEKFHPSPPLLSGIFMNGEIFSPSIEEDLSESMAAAVDANSPFPQPEEGKKWVDFRVTANGEDYQIYLFPLTDPDVTRPAYELSAVPLAPLRVQLSELRLRGSGTGLVALLLGIALAALLSRNLSIPLKKLAFGTEAIRKGELDYRVKISSKDEIGELADSFNEMAEELKQKALYRELLGKVSDETVAQAMINGNLDLELGGEMREVSVLFCDIRGFTELTEQMHPNEVIDLLNDHMTAMTTVVRQFYGVVDKFVGDEIMAIFGGLKSYGNDAELAAACALEMIAVRERLNAELEQPIKIGIGVATGEVVAGCMGSTDRLNYTVVGARVNLASRLCGVAESMEAVIDDATLNALTKDPEAEVMSGLQLKGFSTPVTAYRLTGLNSPAGIPDSVEVSA